MSAIRRTEKQKSLVRKWIIRMEDAAPTIPSRLVRIRRIVLGQVHIVITLEREAWRAEIGKINYGPSRMGLIFPQF